MIKIREVVKINSFFFFSIFFFSYCYTQDRIQILFCNKMKEIDDLKMMQIIYSGDTLVCPNIGNSTFLYPNYFYTVNNKSDTSVANIVFESSTYFYMFEIFKRDLFCSKLDVCFEEFRKGEYRYSYTNCFSISMSGLANRKKKK